MFEQTNFLAITKILRRTFMKMLLILSYSGTVYYLLLIDAQIFYRLNPCKALLNSTYGYG